MDKISLGIPFYGGVPAEWWTQMLQFTAALSKKYDIVDIITCGTMTADHSRNLIASEFLKKPADWLFWIDSDTVIPVGAVERMMSLGKTLVSGVYYGKHGEQHPPIAYIKHNGAYASLDEIRHWDVGEIIKVDSAGMGCCLTHRSVYEDIQKDFTVFQEDGGGLHVVKNTSILGDEEESHPHDNKVYRGQLRKRMIKPTVKDLKFPFFMIDYLRTEDIHFFELAKQSGHQLFLDTSVECGHLRNVAFTGGEFRKNRGLDGGKNDLG